ncbi:flagellar biosynthesis protein FlhF, partial [Candidatus Gottesmanbacteria bacterium]|nr:flagellar biosynthesis protein FlhF [Candidatus Gottesmanbacteria bacterium]
DAYRIAAIEQLKTYAQIMSIPFKVALTPEELKLAISSYENLDLILIDTPGHSQFNKKALDNLEEFLVVAQPADIHLLIALTMKEEDAYFTLDNFAPEYVHQIIFTKLDETSSFGSILNMSNKAKMPISYLTIGQNVPDDIKTANFDFMIDLLLHGQNSIKTI